MNIDAIYGYQGWELTGQSGDDAVLDDVSKGNVYALLQFHIEAGYHQLKDDLHLIVMQICPSGC